MKAEIIAEIGQNHNGNMGIARDLIEAAKKAGADVAKFQLFDARKLFGHLKDYEWFGYNCQTELNKSQVFLLKRECDKASIEFMASAFDEERVAWLEEAGVSRYKVASRSVADKSLLQAIYNTGKPVIMSLGMWSGESFPEVPDPVRITFLFCVSKYPTDLQDLKLGSVDFSKYAGFSDHTIGTSAAIVALSRGARIIEKHITLDKSMYGPDHAGSATPEELAQICRFRDDLQILL